VKKAKFTSFKIRMRAYAMTVSACPLYRWY